MRFFVIWREGTSQSERRVEQFKKGKLKGTNLVHDSVSKHEVSESSREEVDGGGDEVGDVDHLRDEGTD